MISINHLPHVIAWNAGVNVTWQLSHDRKVQLAKNADFVSFIQNSNVKPASVKHRVTGRIRETGSPAGPKDFWSGRYVNS